jgi:hypothetical protein
VQQSLPILHASPGCPQKPAAWHVPFGAQYFEQQVAPLVQLLPTVEHIGLSAPHLPFVQIMLQQSPFAVQVLPSEVHVAK